MRSGAAKREAGQPLARAALPAGPGQALARHPSAPAELLAEYSSVSPRLRPQQLRSAGEVESRSRGSRTCEPGKSVEILARHRPLRFTTLRMPEQTLTPILGARRTATRDRS